MSAYFSSNQAMNVVVTFWLQNIRDGQSYSEALAYLKFRAQSLKPNPDTWLTSHDSIRDEIKVYQDSEQLIGKHLVQELVYQNQASLNTKYGDPMMYAGCSTYDYFPSQFVTRLMENYPGLRVDMYKELSKIFEVTQSIISQCAYSNSWDYSLAAALCESVKHKLLKLMSKRELGQDKWKFNADFREHDAVEPAKNSATLEVHQGRELIASKTVEVPF
tara:strand:+ start:507 stop:1160 length:654 start_codon:yes stop_codon:yes gene_type:complete